MSNVKNAHVWRQAVSDLHLGFRRVWLGRGVEDGNLNNYMLTGHGEQVWHGMIHASDSDHLTRFSKPCLL